MHMSAEGLTVLKQFKRNCQTQDIFAVNSQVNLSVSLKLVEKKRCDMYYT